METYCDLTADKKLAEVEFPLLAKASIENSRYFIFKGIKVYSYRNHELTFFKIADSITEDQLEQMIKAIKSKLVDLINPTTSHMSSIANLVVITATRPSSNLIKKVNKFKYTVNFNFCLKGWCTLNCVIVDMQSKTVYPSKKGKEVASFYQHLLETIAN